MRYVPPDFTLPVFQQAPNARWQPAPADGVLPEGFFSTSNLPTYVKIDGVWKLPRDPRMDAALVLDPDRVPRAVEGRRVRAGQPVAVGYAEDGSEGIYVHAVGFQPEEPAAAAHEFKFMSSEVSREKPVDYDAMARLLVETRHRGGLILWVVGPAVVHARGREVLEWFVERGYVGALFGGNAVAVHDVEAAMFGTTLGMDDRGVPVPGGHAHHMRAINRVRCAGSLHAAVAQGWLTRGLFHALVRRNVPFVLAGSIRDDGPLPDTITDAVAAQDAMRAYTRRTEMALFLATALHAIATGNMLPAYVYDEASGDVRPLPTICVDSTEFVVNKLKDRGTHQAFGVITNVQDFLPLLQAAVERAERRIS